MSKKATRRAARDAFPKARVPVATKPSGGKYSSKTARQKATTTRGAQGLKPPTWRRSLTIGVVLAVGYFLMTRYVLKDSMNVGGELLFSFIMFIFLTLVSYFTDKWTYDRRKKKLQGSGK